MWPSVFPYTPTTAWPPKAAGPTPWPPPRCFSPPAARRKGAGTRKARLYRRIDPGARLMNEVTMALVGDVYVQTPEPEKTFIHAAGYLKQSDIVFGNLETTISDTWDP